MGKLPEEKATYQKERQKEEFKRKPSRNESSDSSEMRGDKKGRRMQET
jgi:hypothetical protein